MNSKQEDKKGWQTPAETIRKGKRFNFETWEGFYQHEYKLAETMFKSGTWTEAEANDYVARLPALWEGINTPNPKPRPRCMACMDQGIVIVPGVGVHPCPVATCWKLLENNQQRFAKWAEVLSTGKLNSYYKDYTLESFLKLPAASLKGKWLAFNAAFLMSKSSDLYIQSHDVYRRSKIDTTGKSNNRRSSLVFYGDVGVGKTGLMVGLGKKLEERLIPYVIVRTAWMLRQIKEPYSKGDSEVTATDILKLYQTIPVLILDEFGLQNQTEADQQYVQEILRGRHANLLPVWVTTNLDADQLVKHWGKQSIDILKEMALFIHVGGEKLRADTDDMREPD